MVRAALRLTKEPPYFLSSISTWTRRKAQILCCLPNQSTCRPTAHSASLPSYPAGLLRVHSCLKGLCISCSPLPLAYGGPNLQAGAVFAAPRQGWPNWRPPRTKGPWVRQVHCCRCQCSALSHAGTASG